jgi:hypothetical protein
MAKHLPITARVVVAALAFSADQASANYIDDFDCEQLEHIIARTNMESFIEYFVSISSFEELYRREDVFLSGNVGPAIKSYGPLRRTMNYYYELDEDVTSHNVLELNANMLVDLYTEMVGLNFLLQDVSDAAYLRVYHVPLDTEMGTELFDWFLSDFDADTANIIDLEFSYCPTVHFFSEGGNLETIDFYYGVLRNETNLDLLNSCVGIGVIRALGLVNYPGNDSILEVNSSRRLIPGPDMMVRLLHSLPDGRPMSRDEFAANTRVILRDGCGISDR